LRLRTEGWGECSGSFAATAAQLEVAAAGAVPAAADSGWSQWSGTGSSRSWRAVGDSAAAVSKMCPEHSRLPEAGESSGEVGALAAHGGAGAAAAVDDDELGGCSGRNRSALGSTACCSTDPDDEEALTSVPNGLGTLAATQLGWPGPHATTGGSIPGPGGWETPAAVLDVTGDSEALESGVLASVTGFASTRGALWARWRGALCSRGARGALRARVAACRARGEAARLAPASAAGDATAAAGFGWRRGQASFLHLPLA
jgi:hypothetical protein